MFAYSLLILPLALCIHVYIREYRPYKRSFRYTRKQIFTFLVHTFSALFIILLDYIGSCVK